MNNRTIDLLIAFLVVAVISVCIASVVKALSPTDFSLNIWAIVGLSSLIGSFVAFLRTKIAGIISGILYATLLSALFDSSAGYSIFSLCLGIVLGVVLHSNPIIVLLISFVYFVVSITVFTVQTAVFFVLTGAASFVIHEYSDKLVVWLSRPLSQLRAYRRPLIGFIFAYAAIVFIFALLYQTSYQMDPTGSFQFSDSWKNDKTFLTFLYLSIAALKSNPPSGITPANGLSKSFTVLESVVGIFVLVIFIKFVLTEFKGSTESTYQKENSHGKSRKTT